MLTASLRDSTDANRVFREPFHANAPNPIAAAERSPRSWVSLRACVRDLGILGKLPDFYRFFFFFPCRLRMEMAAFTALNGGSPKPAEGVNGTADADRTSRQSAGSEPRSAEGHHHSQRDSQRDRERDHERDRERDRESREPQKTRRGSNHERLPFPGAATFSDVEPSHKRKRSISDSPRRERLPSPPMRDERIERIERTERLERSERPERTERSDQYGSHRPRLGSRDERSTPQRDVYRGRDGDEARDGGEHWRAQQAREERTSSYEGPYSAGPVSGQSEEPMGEMLRRATSHGDDDQSPDGDDHDHDHDNGMYSGQYTPEHRRDGVISDPKKRKRNFSNRTKTGCLTCRRRKKKCDEQKPECEF